MGKEGKEISLNLFDCNLSDKLMAATGIISDPETPAPVIPFLPVRDGDARISCVVAGLRGIG